MANNKMKSFGMILKAHYVQKSDKNKYMEAIMKYEASVYGKKVNCEDFDPKTLPKNAYPEDGEDYISNSMVFAQLRSGEYQRVYIIYNSKNESDWIRENAYPKDDRYEHKSNKERFAEELHIRDNRIQTPEKFGDVDGYLHWFCSNAGTKVDVVHIDLNATPIRAYSVSDEFYKEVEHFHKISPRTEAWSQAAGYSRKETISFLMWTQSKRWTEEQRVAFVNGMEKPEEIGTSPDTQIVICPNCGRVTVAAPACVGSINSSGKFVPQYEDSKQMTCQHCGADLSPCFDIDTSIPPERYLYKEQDEESDADDIFESIAELQTEININDIDVSKVKKTKVLPTPWLVQKNNVPVHKVNNVSEIPPQPGLTMYSNCPAVKAIDKIREAVKSTIEKPAPKRRVRKLTPEEEARSAKWTANKTTYISDVKVASGATIEEIRKHKTPEAFTAIDYSKKVRIADSEVPEDFPITVIK